MVKRTDNWNHVNMVGIMIVIEIIFYCSTFIQAALYPAASNIIESGDTFSYLSGVNPYELHNADPSATYHESSFAVAPGVLPEFDNGYDGFDYRNEYSPKLSTIFKKYLKRPSIIPHEDNCHLHDDQYGHYGHQYDVDIGEHEMSYAFQKAGLKIEEYERANQEYLASDPRGLNFSAYVYVASLHSKYNEFVTKVLKNKKCLSRKMIATKLPKVKIPPNPWKKQKYCEMQSPVSLTTYCHPDEPYRRIDGKCNNLMNTNLGSSFHCYRRLLPPDYADGIHRIRLGVDNRPLPSPRLITQLLMPDLDLNDPSLSALHLSWGQVVAHDTYRTIQNLGLAIDCCRLVNPATKAQAASSYKPSHVFLDPAGNKVPIPHPECLPITNFIPNKATEMFNQICLNTVRSIACNTCSLGPRNQMNAATQLLDLSHVYGGNLINNSESLRTYIGGQLLTDFAKNGEIRMVPMSGKHDTDTLDLTPCNPPLNKPNIGCFRTGDGMRGNQNPFIASLQTLIIKRHNHHAAGLHLVNSHWYDEQLFQEARRLTIAEIVKIHFDEYIPLVLGKRLMKYFHLNVRSHGYTKYNPHIDPSSIQESGTSAMRFGHSQTRSLYKVIYDNHVHKTTIMLKDRFFNMVEVWKGQITPIVRGLLAESAKNIDPYGVIDIKDFLFFNPRRPSIVDLFSINVNRGRDHGIPAYVYLLQYCTGYEVHSWKDLEKFMPAKKVKSLRKVYRHYRDIDPFVGGLMEYHLKGSRVGPTFGCLIGIQFYHWKYGDRFYFEHGGEVGSFTPAQLQEIRKKATLANLICKTTHMDTIQVSPFEEISTHNPKIPCASQPDFNYELWRDGYLHK
ncbi:peroxidase-like [Dermatophagoides pteronyssinus]|uniref:peroxidase-like n=1 Tax=Dermatophagoides pteronyssinus TaxID=6956 RepID=UPI003F678763